MRPGGGYDDGYCAVDVEDGGGQLNFYLDSVRH